MAKYLLIVLLLMPFYLRAQVSYVGYEFNEYRHTINFIDHKIVLQVAPFNKEVRYTDPEKKYHWYSNNQIKVTQGGFSGKLLNGDFSDFYLNNGLKEKGRFKMGLKEGEWFNWTEDGILVAKVNYKQGLLMGRFMAYDKAGGPSQEGTYRDGKINGILKTYVTSDSISIERYKDGLKLNPSKGWLKKFFGVGHK